MTFEKSYVFQHSQNWPLCKGYSLCMQKLKPLQNCQFGAKFKILQKMRKTTLQPYFSCSVQKTALKITKLILKK